MRAAKLPSADAARVHHIAHPTSVTTAKRPSFGCGRRVLKAASLAERKPLKDGFDTLTLDNIEQSESRPCRTLFTAFELRDVAHG